MKAVALLLLASIVFLSSFAGMRITIPASESKTCCHKLANAKTPCHSNKKGGDGVPCNPVLSCSVCHYINEIPFKLTPVLISKREQKRCPYDIGNLSNYSNSSWHPPKV